MSYQRFSVQGFLKKLVQKVKFFQKHLTYKRYFVLDHNGQKMRVHKTNEPQSEYKLHYYADITSIYMKK